MPETEVPVPTLGYSAISQQHVVSHWSMVFGLPFSVWAVVLQSTVAGGDLHSKKKVIVFV